MRALILLPIVALLAGCEAPPKAQAPAFGEQAVMAITAYGFNNPKIGEFAWWGCSDDDWWGYHFTATNTAGQTVKGEVCGGLLKGSTVRIQTVSQPSSNGGAN